MTLILLLSLVGLSYVALMVNSLLLDAREKMDLEGLPLAYRPWYIVFREYINLTSIIIIIITFIALLFTI